MDNVLGTSTTLAEKVEAKEELRSSYEIKDLEEANVRGCSRIA